LQIFGEKTAVFSKTNVMINFFKIWLCFESKTPIFSLNFFGENILKIITSVPGHTANHWHHSFISFDLIFSCRVINRLSQFGVLPRHLDFGLTYKKPPNFLLHICALGQFWSTFVITDVDLMLVTLVVFFPVCNVSQVVCVFFLVEGQFCKSKLMAAWCTGQRLWFWNAGSNPR
jgi:hypothetical protein